MSLGGTAAAPQAAGEGWIGARARQEDAFRIRQAPGFLHVVLCDGMGGHVGGQVASEIAVSAAMDALGAGEARDARSSAARLREALAEANRRIGRRLKEEPALKGMGCTLVAVEVVGDRLSWISVGDSPMWLHDGRDLYRLNADHSVRGKLESQVRQGVITAEDADRHPQRNALTSAVMGGPLDVYEEKSIVLEAGRRIILASDGIETLQQHEISAIARAHVAASGNVLRDALLRAVKDRGAPGQDNTTVAIIDAAGGRAPLLAGLSSKMGGVAGMSVAGGVLAACLALVVWAALPEAKVDARPPAASSPGSPPVAATPVRPPVTAPKARPQDRPDRGICRLESVTVDGLKSFCACMAAGGSGEALPPAQIEYQRFYDVYRQCIEDPFAPFPDALLLDLPKVPAPEPKPKAKTKPQPERIAPTKPAPGKGDAETPKAPLPRPAPPDAAADQGGEIPGPAAAPQPETTGPTPPETPRSASPPPEALDSVATPDAGATPPATAGD